MAEFVAAVLSHPKVQAATEQGIGRGMTQFIKSPAFREAMDDLASSMATDVGRHHETARQIGKDVPKLVSVPFDEINNRHFHLPPNLAHQPILYPIVVHRWGASWADSYPM